VSIALIIFATLVGSAATVSGVGKLRRMPQVVETMHAVGVKDNQLPMLAGLELLGAAGLLVGTWLPFIGTLAAIGLTLYFLGAVVAHVRAKAPFSEAIPAFGLMVLALITALLELAR